MSPRPSTPRPPAPSSGPQVLACDATLGYEDVYNVQLLRLNGTPVRNLRHLAELVAAAQRQAREDREARAAEGAEGGAAPAKHFLRFDLEYNEVVVIEVDGEWGTRGRRKEGAGVRRKGAGLGSCMAHQIGGFGVPGWVNGMQQCLWGCLRDWCWGATCAVQCAVCVMAPAALPGVPPYHGGAYDSRQAEMTRPCPQTGSTPPGLGEVTPEVMRSHSIPHPMSADLRAAVAGAGQGAADGQA